LTRIQGKRGEYRRTCKNNKDIKNDGLSHEFKGMAKINLQIELSVIRACG
jgi:hypothetical protein